MKTIFSVLDKRSPSLIGWLSLALVLVLVITVADVVFGDLFSAGPFFFLPIALAGWYGSKRSGISLAVFSAALWVISRICIGARGFSPGPVIYDGVSHLAAYAFLAVIITNFRSVHRVEVLAADTDSLTGVLNPRGFYAEFANELLRSIRYQRVFSLVYIDIDDFKRINDTLGHATGDRVLVAVAECFRSSLRATDAVARLGGDEFACLMPETETETEAAQEAFSKVRAKLSRRMKRQGWPVTFSIGMVTFERPPEDIKEAIAIADDLMYGVKKGEKDNIAYRVWRGGMSTV